MQLVDLFVAIMQVTVSVAIMQLEVSAAFTQAGESFCSKYMGKIFFETMQVGVSVAIMHVEVFKVHFSTRIFQKFDRLKQLQIP